MYSILQSSAASIMIKPEMNHMGQINSINELNMHKLQIFNLRKTNSQGQNIWRAVLALTKFQPAI